MLRHVGIVVNDMDAMLDFYRLLGFIVVDRKEESGEHMDAMLGLPSVRVATVKLAADVMQGPMLELLHYRKPPSRALSEPHRIYDIGLSHIALTVSSVDDEYDRLTEAGVKFVSEPQVSGACKVAFCFDPENNAVELVESLH